MAHHAAAAEPPLVSQGSLLRRLVFLNTPCCCLQRSSSCCGSSQASWLAAMGQPDVAGKPWTCLKSQLLVGGQAIVHGAQGCNPTCMVSPHAAWSSRAIAGMQMSWGIFLGRKYAGLPVWSATQACRSNMLVMEWIPGKNSRSYLIQQMPLWDP